MKTKIIWYAAGGGIKKAGPFESQLKAYEAMVLTDQEQRKQGRHHAEGTYAWCEEVSSVDK